MQEESIDNYTLLNISHLHGSFTAMT